MCVEFTLWTVVQSSSLFADPGSCGKTMTLSNESKLKSIHTSQFQDIFAFSRGNSANGNITDTPKRQMAVRSSSKL